MTPRHFLKLGDRSLAMHLQLFARTHELKRRRARGIREHTLDGKTLVLLFEKASTRTRLSFEAAAFQLGGHCIDLPVAASQVNRGEPITDTAKVIAGYADAVVFRTHGDVRLQTFASASKIPVINGLSDGGHPVQLLADLFTVEEKLGRIAGTTMAFVGDGATNMGLSFIEAAGIFDFRLRLACPVGYQPEHVNANVTITTDPRAAVEGADVVITDVWTSMGQEAETAARLKAFAGFCVDEELMKLAPNAIVLHCLPAHRGEEISAGVIDGPQSVVFDEAENRMHVQKALLEDVLLNPPVLSQLTWRGNATRFPAHVEKLLLEDARAWLGELETSAMARLDQGPDVEVIASERLDSGAYRLTYRMRAKFWGSEAGDYYFRVAQAVYDFGMAHKEHRVLGDTTVHVTEGEDRGYDPAVDERAFVEATLVKHGMR